MAKGTGVYNTMGAPPRGRPYNEQYFSKNPDPYGPPPPPPMMDGRRGRRGGLVVGGAVGMLKVLAGAQLVIGLILLLVGIVHTAIGPMNLGLALITGLSVLWCPLGSIATGIVGLFLSRGNTRDFVCVRRGYQVMCIINAFFFMLLLILTTGFVQLRFYDKDPDNIKASETELLSYLAIFIFQPSAGGRDLEATTVSAQDGYMAMACLIIAFACIEFLLSIIAMSIICCGSSFAIMEDGPERLPPPPPPLPARPPPPLYDDYPREPIYVERERPPRSELAIVPVSRPSHDRAYDEWVKQYYDDYYRDYDRMASKVKEYNRYDRGNNMSIRSLDLARGRPSRRYHEARSLDDYGHYVIRGDDRHRSSWSDRY